MSRFASLAALGRAIASVGSGEVAPGVMREQPAPAFVPPAGKTWRCLECDVTWMGGPRCWCCGRKSD